MSATLSDLFGDVIHTYTREQAIEDGYLVDVSDTAREAGIRVPVAISRAAWEECVTWTRKEGWQDEAGRLWDVIWMLSMAIRRSRGGQEIRYSILRVPNQGRGRTPRPVALTAICGPGDNAEPVITIMLPGED